MLTQGRHRSLARAGSWAGLWLGLAGLYLVLVFQLAAAEIVTGLLTAAVAVGAMVVVRSSASLRFAPEAGWLRLGGRVVVATIRDCGIVLAAIAGRLLKPGCSGRFWRVPLDPGGDDPRSAARRALVVTAASLSPNSIVVAVDRDAETLLLHQLVPTANPPGHGDREWPL